MRRASFDDDEAKKKNNFKSVSHLIVGVLLLSIPYINAYSHASISNEK